MKKFDDSDLKSILRYSEKLKGRTFQEVLADRFSGDELEEKINEFNNPNRKGGLGNLLEEYYYDYKVNSISKPDFEKVETELKVTPFERYGKGIKAGERLVISMIPNDVAIEEEFDLSHLKSKLSKILMIWYERIKSKSRTSLKIEYVNLYDLYGDILKKDLEIIRDDFRKISEKIRQGKAHELSEGDTLYLGACTKGATAETSLKPQFYNQEIPAKRRAFSLKQSYMTYVLNQYVASGLMGYDSIFSEKELEGSSFEDLIISKINKFIGRSEQDLYQEFQLNVKAKNVNKSLVNRILGVKTENAEEFEKANITIKTIRVNKNGIPKESMSFPKLVIKDFVRQDFENSNEYKFFEETKFLFVVFQENNNGEFILKGSKFWNMPIQDLETIGKREWESYKYKFIDGVDFKINYHKGNKLVVKNDLPKKSNHQIFHLRPHAQKSAYVIGGIKYGNGKDKDMDQLLNGDKMTFQSIWLNSEYVKRIISDILEINKK